MRMKKNPEREYRSGFLHFMKRKLRLLNANPLDLGQ